MPKTFRSRSYPPIRVIGAGVVGLCAAVELVSRGHAVEVLERAPELGGDACSWKAGGMLAPWCETESAEPEVLRLGQEALTFWPRHVPETLTRGTLVVAPARDSGELLRFARRSTGHASLNGEGIAALEPQLAGRFGAGLFFASEAHLDPRQALGALVETIRRGGGTISFGIEAQPNQGFPGIEIDCRGFAAEETITALRGVRGEMLLLEAPEIALNRPIRLLHPRFPAYIVPRGKGRFMLGATMIESSDRGPASARSVMDLLNAAHAVHPAFAEARILEIAADVRPAFPDNLPRLARDGRSISINGFFRHGFLLAPAYARLAAEMVVAMLAETPGHESKTPEIEESCA